MTRTLAVLAAIVWLTVAVSVLALRREQFPLNAPHQQAVDVCSGVDLYTPFADAARPPLGVALYIHGGSWTHGDRRSDPLFRVVGHALLERGWAVASADYRFTWPAMLEDASCAADWLRGRFKRVVAWGESAGGHLALLLGVREVVVDRAVSLAGPVDLTDPDIRAPEGLAMFPDLEDASPVTWLDGADPPAFVVIGSEDPYFPSAQVEQSPFPHTIVAGAGHDLTGHDLTGVVDFLAYTAPR